MKLLLSAICASLIIAPLSFAKDCEKGKCDKEKKNEPTLADCGKCRKDGGCDKDKDKKAEGTLAEGGKCKKKCGKEEEKPELVLA